MRIRTFGKFIESENLKKHVLENTTVVVDAQNFFCQQYKASGLQYVFGCESEKYAAFLRDFLTMFKKANVKCYFIFQGGHEDFRKRLTNFKDNELKGDNFDINKDYEHIVLPIFLKDICQQVLDEMGFDFTYCEYESKKECIALAQKLKCPVVSYDIEFCFSGLPYIMYSTLTFDELNNRIKCGIFSLDDFLKKYRLTEEKLAFFVALTDENEFPENHFLSFVKSLKIPLGYYRRNVAILNWLSKIPIQKASEQLFRNVTRDDKLKILDVQNKTMQLIRRQEKLGIPAIYLENGSQLETTENDEFWFQKGVAAKHISKQLINLTRTGILEGTWAIADYTDEDARLLSIDILKYTYNLLTNFEKDTIIFLVNKQEIPVIVKKTIDKPEYNGSCSPFENGWKNIKGDLFEHFLTETQKGFDFEKLNKFPKDMRMLMTALIIFATKKKPVDTRNEVCSILLSYVALGVDADAKTGNQIKDKAAPPADAKGSINDDDIHIAKGVLAKYLAHVGKEEAKRIFDVKLLHPLVEFQHCLENLNHLNILCGKLYEPTIYNKTYNGTFVYKVLYCIKKEYDGNCMGFLKNELNSAPTVLAFMKNLMEMYDDIMTGM